MAQGPRLHPSLGYVIWNTGFSRFCRRGERTGRSHETFVRLEGVYITSYPHPLARTLSYGPKLPLRKDGKDGLPGGECRVIRMLHCLCHLSTRFSEGDASTLRGKKDTVFISTCLKRGNDVQLQKVVGTSWWSVVKSQPSNTGDVGSFPGW